MKGLRFGIVDLGSNAIRSRIIEIDEDGQSRKVMKHRDSLRVGSEVYQHGHLSDQLIEEVTIALREFRSRCHEFDVHRVRAVATAAIRDADNAQEALDRIRNGSGIELEIITGAAEAQLMVQAVTTRIDLSHGTSVLADLGSGSLELAVITDGQVATVSSLPLGALLLHARIIIASPDEDASPLALLDKHLESQREMLADALPSKGADRCLALGGNAEDLSALIANEPRNGRKNILAVPTTSLRPWAERLAKMTIAERVKQLDLRPDRADTILPAAVIFDQITSITGVNLLTVPHISISEGLLEDLLAGGGQNIA